MRHLFGNHNKYLRAEFLPMWTVYLSVRITNVWRWMRGSPALRFTMTNPGFPLGGLYPTSKREILQQLPSSHVPKTIAYIEQDNLTPEKIYTRMKKENLCFPIIIKPDQGVRGLGIRIFHTKKDFDAHMQAFLIEHHHRKDRLIQEFIDAPLEVGVFYMRSASEKKGRISGIVQKEFLFVVGDGHLTLQQLIHQHPRARYHETMLEKEFSTEWSRILELGERLEIVEIGTHSRGSTFLDISAHVTPALEKQIEKLSRKIDGFFYGRYDIRAHSLQDLEQGRFQIMELNLTYAEPTWMYDPSYNYRDQQRILLEHREMMHTIAMENHAQGATPASVKEWHTASKKFSTLSGN